MKSVKKTICLQVNVCERDYKKLAKYGFHFEKNIDNYLHDIAEQIRRCEKEK